jgi:hypothetical protein
MEHPNRHGHSITDLPASPEATDPVDSRRLDLSSVDRRLLVRLGRVSKLGKKVRPGRENLTLEPVVQQSDELVARMQTFSLRPIAEVVRPLLARREPLIAAAIKPPCFVIRSEALEAPGRGFSVDLFPGPLHDDDGARRGNNVVIRSTTSAGFAT